MDGNTESVRQSSLDEQKSNIDKSNNVSIHKTFNEKNVNDAALSSANLNSLEPLTSNLNDEIYEEKKMKVNEKIKTKKKKSSLKITKSSSLSINDQTKNEQKSKNSHNNSLASKPNRSLSSSTDKKYDESKKNQKADWCKYFSYINDEKREKLMQVQDLNTFLNSSSSAKRIRKKLNKKLLLITNSSNKNKTNQSEPDVLNSSKIKKPTNISSDSLSSSSFSNANDINQNRIERNQSKLKETNKSSNLSKNLTLISHSKQLLNSSEEDDEVKSCHKTRNFVKSEYFSDGDNEIIYGNTINRFTNILNSRSSSNFIRAKTATSSPKQHQNQLVSIVTSSADKRFYNDEDNDDDNDLVIQKASPILQQYDFNSNSYTSQSHSTKNNINSYNSYTLNKREKMQKSLSSLIKRDMDSNIEFNRIKKDIDMYDSHARVDYKEVMGSLHDRVTYKNLIRSLTSNLKSYNKVKNYQYKVNNHESEDDVYDLRVMNQIESSKLKSIVKSPYGYSHFFYK